MEAYLIFLGNSFTKLNGEQFKLLYFFVMTMSSEDADALEISIGYIMDVMGKSEKTVRRLIKELCEMGYLNFENGLFSLNIDFGVVDDEPEEESVEETPKKIGYV